MIPVAKIAEQVKPRVGSLWSANSFPDGYFLSALQNSLEDLSRAFIFPSNDRIVTVVASGVDNTEMICSIPENINVYWVKKGTTMISDELVFAAKKHFYAQASKDGALILDDKFITYHPDTYEICGNFFPDAIDSIDTGTIDLPSSLCKGYLIERCIYYYFSFNQKAAQAEVSDNKCTVLLNRIGATAFGKTPNRKSIMKSNVV